MGNASYSRAAYASFSASTVDKSREEIFTHRDLHKDLDPKDITVRESRDSEANPQSTPLIVGIDVTGSMGMLAEAIARHGVGTLFENVLDRKPITDPHLMFMAIGDARSDRAPLQVSQFEADITIVQQLTQIYLEGNGGNNQTESYNFPWYFAAYHTVHDAMEKRGRRGYLFTLGDEMAPDDLTASQIEQFIGGQPKGSLDNSAVLTAAQRFYNVFHIIIEEGMFARRALDRVQGSWRDMLGQQVISLSDYTKLAETIVSTIEISEGADHDTAIAKWEGPTVSIVGSAVRNLPAGKPQKMIGRTA